MIASDDAIYESDYADKIIKFMDKNRNHVFVSGNYDDNRYSAPRGSGRFVRTSYFDKFYECYPEKMGYETAIIHTAEMLGYNYAVLNDVRFEHTRGLGTQHHFYDWGASMKALGYHPLFVLNRFLISFISGKPMGRLGAISMLYSAFAEAAALAGGEDGEGSAQQWQHVGEGVGRDRGDPAVEDREQVRVVNEDEPGGADEALDPGARRGRAPRPARARGTSRRTGRSRRRRRAAGWRGRRGSRASRSPVGDAAQGLAERAREVVALEQAAARC